MSRIAKFQPVDLVKLTFEEFLERDGPSAEWVNGEVVPITPVSLLQDRLVVYLTTLVNNLVATRRLGSIHNEPFIMRCHPALPARSPDLLFVADAHQSRLRDNYLDGPADVAVEVISPDSRARDRGEKFYEYEQGGVTEYWLLDPLRKQAEFYRLQNGLYQVVPLEGTIFRSQALPELWLDTAWLWQPDPPDPLSVARLWGLV